MVAAGAEVVCAHVCFPGWWWGGLTHVRVCVVMQCADIKYLFRPSFLLQRCFTLCSALLNEGWEAEEWPFHGWR